MATKDVELKSGCLACAEPDEPLFVLMGRDWLAPWLVFAWSWLRRCQIYIGFKPPSDFERCDEAAELARQMRAYRLKRRVVAVTSAPVLWAEAMPAEGDSPWHHTAVAPKCDCQCPPGCVKDFAAISIGCPIHGDGA
jgi:hypothetical protein